MSDFKIDLDQIKKSAREEPKESISVVDSVSDSLGFVERPEKRKRGRLPSPRTGQVHAKVLPHVSLEISQEAKRRGVQQGVIIEEAWQCYKVQK